MKKIIVKCCDECPYLARDYKHDIALCDVADRKIMNTHSIPSWCSLEDAVEVE